MHNKLISLANYLDESGLIKEADRVDFLIRKKSEEVSSFGQFPISHGDKDLQGSTRISDLQTKLIEYGYDMDAGADGMFGGQTETVVREFQGQNNLQETGALSQRGYNLLMQGAPERAAEKRIIVALGDSITAAGYIRNLENTMDNVRTFTFGYGGKGVKYIYEQMDNALEKSPSDIVIMAGVNDVASNRSFEYITGYLLKMYLKAKAANIRVVAVTILPWHGRKNSRGKEEVTHNVNNWIKSNPNVDSVVDGSAMGNSSYEMHEEYTSDRIHPNEAGREALSGMVSEQGFTPPAAEEESVEAQSDQSSN
jgi:peptidoglycan hydrolase-like protein with peptidoglycan-binding domain